MCKDCWLFSSPQEGIAIWLPLTRAVYGTRPFYVESPAQIKTHAGPAQKLHASHGLPIWGPWWNPLIDSAWVNGPISDQLAKIKAAVQSIGQIISSRLLKSQIGNTLFLDWNTPRFSSYRRDTFQVGWILSHATFNKNNSKFCV